MPFEMRFDGETVLQAVGARSFVVNLVHWVNQRAVDPAYSVTSHAGGVVRDGVACVLPAHMESGKTTLTAGLVRLGLVVPHRRSGRLRLGDR